jgi:hypothetical protein
MALTEKNEIYLIAEREEKKTTRESANFHIYMNHRIMVPEKLILHKLLIGVD